MPVITPGQGNLWAQVELIHPLEQPSDYGVKELLVDLSNVERTEGHEPPAAGELMERLASGDQAVDAAAIPDSLKDWFRRKDRYEVLRHGDATVRIPFLAAAAPAVPDVEVSATEEVTEGFGGELSFKVAGFGLGASAAVKVASGYTITCAPSESQVAYVMLPVRWELRAKLDNEDYNWLATEVQGPGGAVEVSVRVDPIPAGTKRLHEARVDYTKGGGKPAKISKSYAVELTGDFTVGAKLDAVGLDATVKVSAERSFSVDLDASLPRGHAYEVAWLGGPWGVCLSTSA